MRRRGGAGAISRLRAAAMLLGVALCLVVASPSSARAEEYDPKRAGEPLRIAAYILHPVGVAIDYLVFRPAYWIGSHEPFKTLFGRER